VDALAANHKSLWDVEICHLHTAGRPSYIQGEAAKSFRVNNFFIGENMRHAVNQGLADFVPIFLSEIPSLFKDRLPLNAALISISPPDRHGFCSLGPSVDVTLAAVHHADLVIAQVNKQLPRTHGAGMIHMKNIDYYIEVDDPIPSTEPVQPNEVEMAIGRNLLPLIENGSTLQLGIGAIPNAVCQSLTHHKHLGVHTEMFSDGIIPLVEKGVIDNSQKAVFPGQIVSSFLMGSKKMWDFVNDNPLVFMLPSEYVNDPKVIQRNPKVVAINSAVEIDITGQVCADSIGDQFISGIGGQMDFERGAALSPGGKPIIALPSSTKRGESRIVTFLREGAGVVTSRAHVHWVVTEYGAVNLFGLNVRQRAEKLISIAHPDHRENLLKEARDRLKLGDIFHHFNIGAHNANIVKFEEEMKRAMEKKEEAVAASKTADQGHAADKAPPPVKVEVPEPKPPKAKA